MNVAIATQSLARVDAHFGWARAFMIYDVSAEGYCHVRTVYFGGNLQQDGDDRKLAPKLRALRNCAMVLVTDVGLRAQALLARQDVRPVARFANRPIAEALDEVTAVMRRNPVGWLRRQEQCQRKAQR